VNAGAAKVWEFHVPPSSDAEFRRHYGPGGSWARLFRRSPGYIETLLLHDAASPGRYVTIDLWASAAAYEAFRERFADDYAALDARCEELTTREIALGSFEVVP
jgi:heme-degrading monooxygenase HmoA